MQSIDIALAPDDRHTEPVRSWNPLGRILFRFGFLYFGLFCVFYPQPLWAFLGPAAHWLPDDWFRSWLDLSTPLVKWVGHTFFGVDVVLHDSGSGDQRILWMLVFTILLVSVLGTVLWSVLDRARPDYRRLSAWFLLFIRLCLAGQMLGYGFAKLIPNQMPQPALSTLFTPYGQFAPMGVLWNQVGLSPVYESLLGAAEVTGGLLLLLPRTQLAGVLLSLVSMAQVWVLNMTFDVPVKLLSFHLMLLCLVLLVPEVPRLAAVLTGRAAGAAATPQPFRGRRAIRIAAAAQVLLALWISAGDVWQGWLGWHSYGPASARSELYGVWEVTDFTRDGQSVPPLITDETRWRRVIFEVPKVAAVQRMNDDMVIVGSQFDTGAHRLVLRAPQATGDLADFTYEQPTPRRLLLTGQLDGHPVTIVLDQVDIDRLPLRQGRGLHLIQEDANWGNIMDY